MGNHNLIGCAAYYTLNLQSFLVIVLVLLTCYTAEKFKRAKVNR